jgi:predicted permease
MRALRTWLIRLANVFVFRQTKSEREFSAELQSHLDLHIADNLRAGMDRSEARRRAVLALGGVEQTKERHRDRRRIPWFDELLQDIRLAVRLLLKDRSFTLIAVLVIGLGIGANAAIFSVVDALMLRPLPYEDPDRLVMVWEDSRDIGFPKNTPAPGNYFSWLQSARTLGAIAATRGATANLTLDGTPEFVTGRRVTANFFQVLGVRPLLGRVFTEAEDRSGEPVTLISYGLWQRRLGGDGNAVGRAIVMNGERRTVIGVMPKGFVFRNREVDFWNPIRFTTEQETLRTSHFLNVVARLTPRATVADAKTDLQAIAERLKQEFPVTNRNIGAVVEPLKSDLLGETSLQLIVLLAASGCVLLIACANVAGLLLLRAAHRRGEFAVRASLGATAGRIARQLGAEAMLLALAGTIVGVALAPAGERLLTNIVPMGMLPLEGRAMDGRVMLIALVLACVAGVTVSVLPVVHISRVPIVDGLQQAGRFQLAGPRLSRDLLVVCQLAVAGLLLVGTGLLLQTFANLRSVEIGFQPEHLLTVRTTLPLLKYPEHANRVAFFERVVEEVRSLPGVENAAYVSTMPFGSTGNTAGYVLEGRPDREEDALMRVGTADYLKTIRAQLIEGRLPDARDRANASWVVVVNETFARINWPDQSALGHRVTFGGPPLRTIIGVVKDVRERGYQPDMKPAAYIPYAQVGDTPFIPETLIVRASGDLNLLVPGIRRAVATVDPEQPLAAIRTMQEMLDLDIADRKQQTILLGVFTAVAVFLAGLGLYGLLAYAVAQRKQEIAVRMALGASAASVLRMIAASGQKLVAAGLSIGLGGAWLISRGMRGLLYGVAPSDLTTFAAAGTLLWLVALVAFCIPAVKAARINPASLLRGE